MKKRHILLIFIIANIFLYVLVFNKEQQYTFPNLSVTSNIRHKVSQEVDWGTKNTQLKMKVFTNDSRKLSKMFENDEGAVMCQGAAYYLHLKYLDANFRSYLVGFQSKLFSHAMVLVEIKRQNGEKALIIQDPSFNVTYVDRAGIPFSIYEIMDKLSKCDHDAIHIDGGGRKLNI